MRLSKPLFNLTMVVAWYTAAMLAQLVPLPTFLRLFLVLPLLGFVPGYVIMGALFPAPGALRMSLRGVLAVLLSLCITPAVATALEKTPWGIRPLPMISSLMIVSICAVLIGWWREKRLKGLDAAPLERGQRPLLGLAQIGSRGSRAGSVLFLAVVVTGAYWTLLAPAVSQPFTEFYIEPEMAPVLSDPGQGAAAEEAMLPLTVVNHESEPRVYSVEVVVDGVRSKVAGPMRVEDGGRWQTSVPVAREPGASRRVELQLYREGDQAAYRTLHVWVGPTE